MNNGNKVETAIAGLNCWASYATGDAKLFLCPIRLVDIGNEACLSCLRRHFNF